MSDAVYAYTSRRLSWFVTGTAITSRSSQRVNESDLLRDAVLLLQGVNGRYTRFQDAPNDIPRCRSGLPLHPLEQLAHEDHVEGQLLFVVPEDEVSVFSRKICDARRLNMAPVCSFIFPPQQSRFLLA